MKIKEGDTITFMHGEEELKGICNGEVWKGWIPVHVRNGNRNIMVHPDNVVQVIQYQEV